MSSELQEIDDSGVRAAFAEYGTDPGGEIRIDVAGVAIAGQRRVRRQRIAYSAAGVTAIALLVSGAVVAPQPGDGPARDDFAEKPVLEIPSSGREPDSLFREAPGWHDAAPVKLDGTARELGQNVAATFDEAPHYMDVAWQPGVDGPDPETRWALFTWVDGVQAAEALLTVQDAPVYALIYPPPYQVCSAQDTESGSTCAVREVKGEGWLKVIRGGDAKKPELIVRLQRGSEGGELVTFRVAGGPVTSQLLAGTRAPLNRLPISADDATKAVLEAL